MGFDIFATINAGLGSHCVEVIAVAQLLADFVAEDVANLYLPLFLFECVVSGIERYHIEEVDIVVGDE